MFARPSSLVRWLLVVLGPFGGRHSRSVAWHDQAEKGVMLWSHGAGELAGSFARGVRDLVCVGFHANANA